MQEQQTSNDSNRSVIVVLGVLALGELAAIVALLVRWLL